MCSTHSAMVHPIHQGLSTHQAVGMLTTSHPHNSSKTQVMSASVQFSRSVVSDSL